MDTLRFTERLAEISSRHFAMATPGSDFEGFKAGRICVQHDPARLAGAMESALALAYESHGGYKAMADAVLSALPGAGPTHPTLASLARHVFEEKGSTLIEAGLCELFGRLARIEPKNAREWAKPYYAKDPDFDRSQAVVHAPASRELPKALAGAGATLADRAAAIEAEHLAPAIDPALTSSSDFCHGKFYIQHDVDGANAFLAQALLLAYDTDSSYRSFVDKKIAEGKIANAQAPILLNMCSQYIQGSGARPLDLLLGRCFNIDMLDGTEWGQPYFVIGGGRSERAGAECLNPGVALARKERSGLEDATPNPGAVAQPSPRL